jgi:hypothetical protein
MANPRTEQLKSIAEWDALKERYPIASRWELVRQGAVVLIANAVTARLVMRGELRPWELVALVAIEAVAFTAIAWIQSRLVPASALMEKPVRWSERLGMLAFALFWLVGVYGLILGAWVHDLEPMRAAARDPLAALRASALRWPLAISLFGALTDAIADWRFWRTRGGYFLSTPGFSAGARWLTLFLGGIPFFVPFAIGGWLVSLVAKKIERRVFRPGNGGNFSSAPLMLVPLLVIGVFLLIGKLIGAGVAGWAIGYCAAKVASEALIVCLPLIATKASEEERAGLGAQGKGSI